VASLKNKNLHFFVGVNPPRHERSLNRTKQHGWHAQQESLQSSFSVPFLTLNCSWLLFVAGTQPSTSALVKAAALAAQQAAAGEGGRLAPRPPGPVVGGQALQVAQLREQAERNAAELVAGGRRSKWDSAR
jgi:hypothetical protein